MIIDYMSLKYLIKGYFLQLFMATKVEEIKYCQSYFFSEQPKFP